MKKLDLEVQELKRKIEIEGFEQVAREVGYQSLH